MKEILPAIRMNVRQNTDVMKMIVRCLPLLTLLACSQKKAGPQSENDLDAARNFIQAALSNDFKKASQYMLDDSVNRNYLEVTARSFDHLDPLAKEKYRGASIRIHQPVTYLNDSTTIVIYSNSYKNDPDTLRVCRVDNNWVVDLKYLFERASDSTTNNQ
jgi:hypothetical protein